MTHDIAHHTHVTATMPVPLADETEVAVVRNAPVKLGDKVVGHITRAHIKDGKLHVELEVDRETGIQFLSDADGSHYSMERK